MYSFGVLCKSKSVVKLYDPPTGGTSLCNSDSDRIVGMEGRIMFSSIPTAIEELKKGNMLIVVDDPTRENQGDVIFPAETVTQEKVNFLMKECRGMFCVPMAKERATRLDIAPMVPLTQNTEKLQCNFGVTVDAKNVTSFGISAHDRMLTVQTLTNASSKSSDLVRPGHVSPLLAVDGGVAERAGHTEATVDLARLAGFAPVGVLSEIINDQGHVANAHDLQAFSQKHNIQMITIPDLIAYIKVHPLPPLMQPDIVRVTQATLPTKYGIFQIVMYKSLSNNQEHTILTMGEIQIQPVQVRIHSQCFTGDTLFSLRCDCREQLEKSMEIIGKTGGVLVYLNQEGRGIGLTNKIKAYALQDKGLDTVQANESLGFAPDGRDYKIATDILKDLGITEIKLLTNNPNKIEQLTEYGIHVIERIPLEITPNQFNKNYLETKKHKLHHQLTEV